VFELEMMMMELTLSLKVILRLTLNLEAIISDLYKFPAEEKRRPALKYLKKQKVQ
jgi:hypothetical protein